MCPLRNCISRFPTPWGEMPRAVSGIKKSMRPHALFYGASLFLEEIQEWRYCMGDIPVCFLNCLAK